MLESKGIPDLLVNTCKLGREGGLGGCSSAVSSLPILESDIWTDVYWEVDQDTEGGRTGPCNFEC